MKTATVNIYSFSELSDKAKAKALENHRYHNTEGFPWWDYIYDDWYERLGELGYSGVKIYFSGFSSQGDGACFVGDVDVETWLQTHNSARVELAQLCADTCNVNAKVISIDSHYSHENTVRAEVECYGYVSDEYKNQANRLEELITEDVRTLSREIYKELEAGYEWEVSDEAVGDSLEVNEYEFDKFGNDLRCAYEEDGE